jgi:NhaA family Na+:H+ antiporter
MTSSPPSAGASFFTSVEARSGAVLVGAAMLAMVIANGPLAQDYFALLALQAGPLSLHHWINDALMALFFLGVGLEVKREFLVGELSLPGARPLPVIAAACGMAVPALVFLTLTRGDGDVIRGWAIPVATDIAFALGLLALVGRRIPPSLRLFLTTVAIVDDLGAVAVIAFAYTPSLDWTMLAAAFAILAAMTWIASRKVDAAWPYLLLSALLWIAVYRSGIHPTVAGVLAALAIPLRPGQNVRRAPPLQRIEHALQPIVAYGIVPLFGFANAGLSFSHLGWGALLGPLPIAIALALFIGKQAGIMLGIGVAIRLGMATRPAGASTAQLYGVALLCGIGFTMSLFIGGLAFADPLRVDAVKAGVLGGSLLSAISGLLVLRFARPARC